MMFSSTSTPAVMKIPRFLNRLIPRNETAPRTNLTDEDLRAAETLFRKRYHAFRRLLRANSEALEHMADMEMTLRGTEPFGMVRVRSQATAVTTAVFKIVRSLSELAPEKYDPLSAAFKTISRTISEIIEHRPRPRAAAPVMDLSAVTREHADLVGPKTANVGELKNTLALPVPPGFAVTTSGYDRFIRETGLAEEINRLFQTISSEQDLSAAEKQGAGKHLSPEFLKTSAKIRHSISTAPLPEDLSRSILDAYDQLCRATGRQVRMAVRSSGLGEDLAETSFAGQYRSRLNVDRAGLLQAFKDVVASKFSPEAIMYRYARGIRDEEVPICVGCMEMVEARAGGVMYTRNPMDIRDMSMVVTSAWGLPKSVVDGAGDSDVFRVSRMAPFHILERTIPVKETMFACGPEEGVVRLQVPEEDRERPSLPDRTVSKLAEIGARIEAHYGPPQDIEWALSPSGDLILLQSRPLALHPASGPKRKSSTDRDILITGGTPVSPGIGAGPVCMVRRDVDILLFPENGILVSSRADPKWAAVLPRAAGVITETGSATGHLANVAREFRVPALFQVSDATTLLVPGQEITLDADTGRVHAGRVEELLAQAAQPGSLMLGSPVHTLLQEISGHILPLHLTDPDSPYFKASACRTLHDITRFAHEKAVREMFAFGRDHAFSPRSSKQLKSRVPMQWWLLDLDGGFKQEVTGKYVTLAEIASIPMLAIWRGVVAIPWEGPPGMDGRGFVSVLLQATSNPQLNTATASNFGDRNYFMISRNFCNLQSRFGFHFTSIEALVGDRDRENSIRFRFQGGAADLERRIRRAEFVGEILERYDFQTAVRDDALQARLDDRPQPFMEERLSILGYLLMHTRQLDMIMAREEVVAGYRDKLLRDIERVRAGLPG